VDQVFAALDDLAYERLVDAWAAALAEAGAAEADLLHLHHLTPANAAAARVCPQVPVVGHLHGTELAMLRTIDAGTAPGWPYASAWAARMRGWAQQCTRLLVPPALVSETASLLGVPRARIVALPGGVDTQRFEPRPLNNEERLAFWHRALVEQPQGWDESGRPGSIAYTRSALWPFRVGETIFLYAGRFTRVKRLPLLIRAHTRALRRLATPAPLVLVGGHPGEWEGEHPLTVARAMGNDQVFFAGWWPHERLPGAMNAADVLVLPSVAESFGLALVEAMACGLPVIAADACGPADIVPAGAGWLVPADDEDALADALIAATAQDAPARDRRSRLACHTARSRYGWPRITRAVAATYADAARETTTQAAGSAGSAPGRP